MEACWTSALQTSGRIAVYRDALKLFLAILPAYVLSSQLATAQVAYRYCEPPIKEIPVYSIAAASGDVGARAVAGKPFTLTIALMQDLATKFRPAQQVDDSEAVIEAGKRESLVLSDAEKKRQQAGGECRDVLSRLQATFDAQRNAMQYPDERDLAYFAVWYHDSKLTAAQKEAAKPVINSQWEFDKACLSKQIPSEMNPDLIRRAYGVLMYGEQVFCSGLRIKADTVLTARHCFIKADSGKQTSYTKLAAEGKASLWFAYEAEPELRFEVCRTGIPASGNHSIAPQDDHIEVRIASTAQPLAPIRFVKDPIRAGTSLYMRGYFAFGSDKNQIDRLRATAHGGCIAMAVRDRCIFHGCQSIPLTSGAPIFLRSDGSTPVSELTLAALHLGPASLAPSSLCNVNGDSFSKSNFGYLPPGE
jgi:hypothetical protein